MFENAEGLQVPFVALHTHRSHQWGELTSDHICKDKTVIVFSPPGAFTATCFSSHVLCYNELAPVFREHAGGSD